MEQANLSLEKEITSQRFLKNNHNIERNTMLLKISLIKRFQQTSI
jgi:hypothetical protein